MLLPPHRNLPPEVVGGLFSRATFWWLVPLLRTGMRRELSVDDLFAVDPQLSSFRRVGTVQMAWPKGEYIPVLLGSLSDTHCLD